MSDDTLPTDNGEHSIAPRPRRRQALWAVSLVLGGLIAPAAGIALAYRSCDQGASRGQLVVENTALGSWRRGLLGCTMAPGATTEVSLDRDDGIPIARIFYDRGEPVVELTEPSGNRTLRLDRSLCKLTVEPRRVATSQGGIDLRGGSVVADCTLLPSGRVTIDAWWQHCKSR